MTRALGPVHPVGVAACAAALPALVALPFAVLRGSRIQTGDPVGLAAAVGLPAATLLVALWLALLVLALRDVRGRRRSAARGLVAGALIVAVTALSGAAARDLAAGAGPYARVSIGGGAWAAILAAYAVVLSARREVGAGQPLGVAIAAVAPAGVTVLLAGGALDGLGILREYANQSDRFWDEVGAHMALSAVSALLAVVVGGALAVAAFGRPRLARPVFGLVNLLQTIPGLAMIGLLVPVLAALSRATPGLRVVGFGGLGWAPVVIALTLYALLPVVRNTYAGLAGVPVDTVDAARGMGLSERQVLARVRLPLAAPVLWTGVRVAAVQTLGNATLGAFAAAGTLGLFVFGGLAQQSTDLILLGSLAIVAVAVLADGAFRLAAALMGRRGKRAAGPA